MRKFPRSVLFFTISGLLLLIVGDLYRSFGFLVSVAGCLFLLCGWLLFLRWISNQNNRKTKQIAKIVKAITFSALTVFFVSFIWIEGLILAHDDGTECPDAQTVIVLGAGLNGDQPSLTLIARLQTALDYLQANPASVVIVSGGQGAYETVSEASAMALWLTKKGVDPSRIYLEDRSTDTQENLIFSRKLMEDNDLTEPVAVVSNSFHLYRAEILAHQAGFSLVQTLSAPVPKVPLRWLSASVYLREYCSILLMFLQSVI